MPGWQLPVAFLADLVFGDPPGIPNPVRLFGPFNLSSEFFSLRDAFRGRYINRPGPMQVGWARDEGDMQIYIGNGALKVLDENPFKTTDRRRAHVFARQPAHKGQRAPTAREEP